MIHHCGTISQRVFLQRILPFIACLFINIIPIHSQNLPPHRFTSWSEPGAALPFTVTKTLFITDYGADSTGTVSCDIALQQAILALNGPGRIHFPSGKYLFLQKITLPDSIILEGYQDPLTNTSRSHLFLSPGNNQDGIHIMGQESSTGIIPSMAPIQGDHFILVDFPHPFFKGDIIRLHAFDDSLLVNNSWAFHTTGQISEINSISDDTIFLEYPIRRSYNPDLLPLIYRVTPRQQVHIHCLQMERLDTTSSQSSNISFTNARNCTVRGVSSSYCNFAHIDIRSSSRITVDYCFFTNAFDFGGGGKAYGVVLQSGSSSCFIHANNFKLLRHSMLLQSGANGNVLAYNYSTEPFWTGTLLPSNSAGDIVLHGNYPYMNLFEGNVIQNIVIDNSHGINGPYNTFFRNRAELFGLFMNTSPASNQQNFIGNQVTNTSSPFYGLYALQGLDHYAFGNMIKGTIMPSGSDEPSELTLFEYPFSSFYKNVSQIPPIQTSNWMTTEPLIEASYRATSFDPTLAICDEPHYEPLGLETYAPPDNWIAFPNPVSNQLHLHYKATTTIPPTSFILVHITGQTILSGILTAEEETLDIGHFNPGMYWLIFNDQKRTRISIVKLMN